MLNAGSVMTAMITPFDENLNVDFRKAADLASQLVQEGSDSIVVAGTTGESPTLSKKEKLRLIEAVKENTGDRFPLIAGTGSYDTKETVELTVEAHQAGADGFLVVAPYYNKPPQSALYRHFAMIAEKTEKPIILYNIPGRTGVNISNEIVEKLAKDYPHICAMKDAAGNLEQTTDLAIRTNAVQNSGIKPGFRIYSGDDSMTLPMLACGATGVVSVASHVAAGKIKAMVQSFFEGKTDEAVAFHRQLFPLFKGLFATTNPILVKEALRLRGIETGGLRPPLWKAQEEEIEALKLSMQKAGVL